MTTIKEIRKKALDTGLSINYFIEDIELSKIFKKNRIDFKIICE